MQKQRALRILCLVLLAAQFLLLSTAFGQDASDFAYYRLGVKYKKEKNYDKAIEAFRKVLAVYPDNFNSYYQIAEIRIEEKKLGLAAYELKKALEYKPNWPDAQYLLAKCYEDNQNYEKALIEWRKFTQVSKDEKRNAEAEERIKKLMAAIRKDAPEPEPDKADTAKPKVAAKTPVSDSLYKDPNYKAGVEYFTKKQYAKALEEFKKALKKHPRHPGAFYYAGVIRYDQKNYDMAEFNLRKAFGFAPLGFNAHYYLGLIYEEQKKIDPGIAEFRSYQKMTKSAAGKKDAQVHIDKLLAMKGSAPSAPAVPDEKPEMLPLPPKPFVYQIDDLLAFLIEDTTLGEGRIMMDAVNLYRSKNFDAALKKFKSVLLVNPKSALADDATYNVGICYMRLRLFDNAENQFDQLSTAYASSPLLDRADYLKGITQLEKDQFANAEKLFRKWIRTFPKSDLLPYAYARLGDALVKQDLAKDGIEAYRASLPFFKTEKEKLPVLFAIGENYQNLDNAAKASEYFEQITRMAKTVGISQYVHDAYLKLGDHYYGGKKWDKAQQNYEIMIGSYPTSTDVAWAKFQIGNIYRHKDLFDSAIQAYTELIRNYPEEYWARQARWKLDDTVWQNEYRDVIAQ